MMASPPLTVYDFSFTKPDGSDLKLSQLRGRVLLIVNTAGLLEIFYLAAYHDMKDKAKK